MALQNTAQDMTVEPGIRPVTGGISVTRRFVTPDLARVWLGPEHNRKNRRVRSARVAEFARDMAAGRWQENAVPIVFGWDKQLLDGQHRLHAIVRSGAAQWLMVAHNVDPASYDTYDQNSVRTTADFLDKRGMTDSTTLAGALRLLWMYRRSGTFGDTNQKPTRREILEHIENEPGIENAVAHAKMAYQRGYRTVSPSLMAALYQVLAGYAPDDVDEFFERWTTGLGLESKDDPIYRLRQRVEDPALTGDGSRVRTMKAALAIKAWNFYRTGKPIGTLKWLGASGEAFPTPK